MFVTVYPNNEVRVRVPRPPVRSAALKSLPSPRLVNSAKLAITSLPPAELCSYPSCSWPRVGYGGLPKGVEFSSYAKKKLSRAGGVFCPAAEERVVFLTGTLPGGTVGAMEALARYSSWMVHQLVSVLPRVAGCLPSETRYLWVWEFQERGALHWHCVLELPTTPCARMVIEGFKPLWCQLIDSISERSGVDLAERAEGGTWAGRHESWRVDAQFAVKSPSQYLAKYLSKDASKVESENAFLPTRWYGCSRSILSALRFSTIRYSSPRPAGVPHFSLLSSDIEILSELHGFSSFAANWPDKYGSGHSFVFFIEDDFMKDVEKTVAGKRSVVETDVVKVKAKKLLPVDRIRTFVWHSVDRVISVPYLSERLYNDIGAHYRAQLDLYRAGMPSLWGDMYWVERHAEYLLYLQSGGPGVNSKAPPIGGLTPQSAKNVGKEGPIDQLILDGLPY